MSEFSDKIIKIFVGFVIIAIIINILVVSIPTKGLYTFLKKDKIVSSINELKAQQPDSFLVEKNNNNFYHVDNSDVIDMIMKKFEDISFLNIQETEPVVNDRYFYLSFIGENKTVYRIFLSPTHSFIVDGGTKVGRHNQICLCNTESLYHYIDSILPE